jgi:hypothetical protein
MKTGFNSGNDKGFGLVEADQKGLDGNTAVGINWEIGTPWASSSLFIFNDNVVDFDVVTQREACCHEVN